MLRALRSYPVAQYVCASHSRLVWLSRQPYSTNSPSSDEEEQAAARKWAASFDRQSIPRTLGTVEYSRSSGPGGQNVNKYVTSSIP